jgi:hypothetical protein
MPPTNRRSFVRVLFPPFLFAATTLSVFAQTPPPTQTPSAQIPSESIIEQIKKAVVFIQGSFLTTQVQVVNGVQQLKTVPATLTGTGFLVWIPDPRLGDRGQMYLATNKHMLKEPGANGTLGDGPFFANISVRVNLKQPAPDGTQFSVFPIQVVDETGSLQWFVHSDENVDLAITPLGLDDRTVDFKEVPGVMFANKDVLAKEKVDENDEVLFSGLFAWNPGTKKNLPIVRHGRLARLSDERIPLDRNHPDKTTEVYLAEVMSFGGNSGSPVFLRLNPLREGTVNDFQHRYFLLGVMQGFFPEGMDFAVEVAEVKGKAEQNSGLAAVVPCDKIIEILNSPRGRAWSDSIAANYLSEKGNFADAEKLYKAAIETLEKSSPQNSQLGGLLRLYAAALRKNGRATEAVALEKRATQLLTAKPIDRMNPAN